MTQWLKENYRKVTPWPVLAKPTIKFFCYEQAFSLGIQFLA